MYSYPYINRQPQKINWTYNALHRSPPYGATRRRGRTHTGHLADRALYVLAGDEGISAGGRG